MNLIVTLRVEFMWCSNKNEFVNTPYSTNHSLCLSTETHRTQGCHRVWRVCMGTLGPQEELILEFLRGILCHFVYNSNCQFMTQRPTCRPLFPVLVLGGLEIVYTTILTFSEIVFFFRSWTPETTLSPTTNPYLGLTTVSSQKLGGDFWEES